MAKEQTPVPTLTTNSGSPVEDNQQHHCRTAWSGAAPGLLVAGKVTARDSVAATLPFLPCRSRIRVWSRKGTWHRTERGCGSNLVSASTSNGELVAAEKC